MTEQMVSNVSEPTVPDFDTPHLAQAIEQMAPATVDNLPFGVIRLNAGGKVMFFSESERRLSGYRKDVLDRPFFSEIAPCMNNTFFKQRIDDALAKGTLNMTFDHIGDFDDAAKALRVRVQSASGGGCWLFLQRED
jgi:photoactive yellow protein